MFVKQPKDVGVEAIEASDFVDRNLVVSHAPILFKLLDFVKQFEFRCEILQDQKSVIN